MASSLLAPPSSSGKYILTSGVVEAINGTLTCQGQQSWVYIGPTSASITSISPTSGPTGGGTEITVTGAGFTGANTVLVGATPVAFKFVNDREITAITKPSAAGTYDVRVETQNDGTTPVTVNDHFAFIAPTPHLSEILGQQLLGD